MEFVSVFSLIQVQIARLYYVQTFAVDMENAQKMDVNVIKDLKELIVHFKSVTKIVEETENV
jgi:hypothetical protein